MNIEPLTKEERELVRLLISLWENAYECWPRLDKFHNLRAAVMKAGECDALTFAKLSEKAEE
jgi:hypothetical protein